MLSPVERELDHSLILAEKEIDRSHGAADKHGSVQRLDDEEERRQGREHGKRGVEPPKVQPAVFSPLHKLDDQVEHSRQCGQHHSKRAGLGLRLHTPLEPRRLAVVDLEVATENVLGRHGLFGLLCVNEGRHDCRV